MVVADCLLLQKTGITGSVVKRERKRKRGREEKAPLVVKRQLINDKCSEDEESRKCLSGQWLFQAGIIYECQGRWVEACWYKILVSLEYLAIKYLLVTKINVGIPEWRNLAESNLDHLVDQLGLVRVTLGTSPWNALWGTEQQVYDIFAKSTCSGSVHEETLDEPRLRDILWNERLIILSNSRKTGKDGGTQET